MNGRSFVNKPASLGTASRKYHHTFPKIGSYNEIQCSHVYGPVFIVNLAKEKARVSNPITYNTVILNTQETRQHAEKLLLLSLLLLFIHIGSTNKPPRHI